jgi:hypothetical protein
MKVSIENILNSARKINKQRQPDEQSQNNKKGDIKIDSVEIGNRVMSRLDGIQRELKDVQSSLTKSQIIKDGLRQLTDDFQRGGNDRDLILNNVEFDKKKILREFIGENLSKGALKSGTESVSRLIGDDISKIKKLQIEIENILASDVASSERIKDIIYNIGTQLDKTGMSDLKKISSLKSDAVMRHIKE